MAHNRNNTTSSEDDKNNQVQLKTSSPLYKAQVTEDDNIESQKKVCEDEDDKWTKDGECKFKNDK